MVRASGPQLPKRVGVSRGVAPLVALVLGQRQARVQHAGQCVGEGHAQHSGREQTWRVNKGPAQEERA